MNDRLGGLKLTRKILITLVAIASILSFEAGFAAAEAPAVLGLKDQGRVVDGWLKVRLDTVLPELMRREKFDMWLVVCEEYNEDPVYLTLVPFEDISARRLSMLVFYDRGEGQAIEKVTVSRYGIGDLYKSAWDPAKDPDQWQRLVQVIKDRRPKRIGIDESETFAFGDGLTASLKERLVRVLGKEYASRLQSAERLAVGWLERRIPEELETYPHVVAIAHAIIAEAFSRDVITPGATTAEDVSWWMRERIRGLGLSAWFHPDISIQRPKTSLAKGDVIHRGDLLHCDMGITYLRLNTDTQQHAYVLKEGEADAPQGLKDALAQGNKLQDILLAEFREGRTGNEVLAAALAKAKSEGLKPSIYTHPLGYHGHAAGPTIGLWDQQNGVPGAGDYPLFYDTVYSIELNAKANAPEWDNQEVTIALEQDAAFTRKGTYFLDERQTKFILIK
jgi:Xaa-Pro aminopeptidase